MALNVNKICHFFYELALLLTFSVCLLAPIHIGANRHYNIDKILSPTTVSFTAQNTAFLIPGDSLPIYRFNPDWTAEIGRVKVVSIEGNEVIGSYNPKEFRWPMGRQARIVDVNGSMVKVAMGSDLGLKVGDDLRLFKDRNSVGKIQLQEVYPDYSWARLNTLLPGTNLFGLTASEFIYVTQAAFFKNPFITAIEILIFIVILMTHVYVFFVYKTSLFMIFGDWLRRQYQKMPQPWFHGVMNIFLGIPFVWFMVNFFPRCFVYLSNVCMHLINPGHQLINMNVFNLWFHQNVLSLYIIGGASYYSILIWKKASPIILFWQWTGYKLKEKVMIKGIWRDLLIWSLHLVIFYAFGRTLLGFLMGNLNAALNLLWPNTTLSWANWFNLFHLPSPKVLTPAELFEVMFLVMRYLLWSITIVGCFFGYWYSVFGYLYGKRIRNLDFTVMGWMTNAVCYGPLLGIIIWQMTPSLRGPDPVLIESPLRYFTMITELVLNLFYTLSIWNLGTMFGVMTDKGVRTSGFYSVVRHPSYTLEAFMFIMIFFNGLSTHTQWLAAGMFIFTYYVRSEREDQFMAVSNPEYKLYQQQTPYKFIPGIY